LKKNGKKKRKKRKIGETRNRPLKKRGYIVSVRRERATQTQSDKIGGGESHEQEEGKEKIKEEG